MVSLAWRASRGRPRCLLPAVFFCFFFFWREGGGGGGVCGEVASTSLDSVEGGVEAIWDM